MKIRSVECDQFAGIRSQRVEFSDGLNLMIGENESGKSTLADLIYQIFFQPVVFRRNSGFTEKYFPKTANGTKADYVDGTLCFETEEGIYKLSKEWENGKGSSRLRLPDGMSIKAQEEIDAVLREKLKFKDGVYREIIFPSQKREQWVLETILNGVSKDTADLRENFQAALTKAALETGGVSLNKLESSLDAKIRNLSAHWDPASDLPEGGARRGINNPWKREVGAILEAWYAREAVRQKLKEAAEAEQKIENCTIELKALEEKKNSVRDRQEQFHAVRDIIGRRQSMEALLETHKREIGECRSVIEQWPQLTKAMEQAEILKRQLSLAEAHARFAQVESIRLAAEEKRAALSQTSCVSDEDVAEYTKQQNVISRCKRDLSGMNIAAKIQKLGAADIIVRSAATGVQLTEVNGQYRLDGAVEIEIPGVMKMQLMPEGVDIADACVRLKDAEAAIGQLNTKYAVANIDELRDRKAEYRTLAAELATAERKLTEALAGEDYEELKRADQAVPADLEKIPAIKAKIRDLCGIKPLEGYIGGLRTRLDSFAEKYGSEDKLKSKLDGLNAAVLEEQESLDSVQSIPEAFCAVEDPVKFDQDLSKQLKDLDERIGNLKKQQGEAENSLGRESAEELAEQLEQRDAEFISKKTEHRRWLEIRTAFHELKAKSTGNPAQDIADRFAEYLSILSNGRLKLHEMDEKLCTHLSSGDYELACEYLSEGTKDTVMLAFRLAMLVHLFPEGGGLAVFDDPFTDMDPQRLAKACELIRRFAEHNQVIFITCDDKYRKIFDGNVINV